MNPSTGLSESIVFSLPESWLFCTVSAPSCDAIDRLSLLCRRRAGSALEFESWFAMATYIKEMKPKISRLMTLSSSLSTAECTYLLWLVLLTFIIITPKVGTLSFTLWTPSLVPCVFHLVETFLSTTSFQEPQSFTATATATATATVSACFKQSYTNTRLHHELHTRNWGAGP